MVLIFLLFCVTFVTAYIKCDYLNITECEVYCECVLESKNSTCFYSTEENSNPTSKCNLPDNTVIIVLSLIFGGYCILIIWCCLMATYDIYKREKYMQIQ